MVNLSALNFYLCYKDPHLKKFLIIRFSSIGDIVATTAVIRCLKKTYPESKIHYLCKSAYAEVLGTNPYIDKLHLFNGSLKDCLKELRKEKFDLIIDLHKSLRSRLVKHALFKPSISYSKLNVRKWIFTNFKKDLLPDQHINDRYFRSLQKIKVPYDDNGMDFFIKNNSEEVLEILPLTFKHGFYAIVIGAGHNTKQLTIEKHIELIDQLGLPVVLIGGEVDFEMGRQIVNASKNEVFNSCGLLSIQESAALINAAEKVVTNDTGMMHIAAALNKDMVVIWGSTHPKFGLFPLQAGGTSRVDNVSVKIKCRPCSKIGYDKCPKTHFRCMKDQNVDEILSLL